MIYLHNRIPFWQQEGSHKTSTRTFCFLLSRSPASVPNSRPTTPQVGCSVQSTGAAAFRGPCAPHQSTPGEKAAGADGKNLHTDSKHNTWAVKADCSKFNKLLISHQCKSAAKHTHTHTHSKAQIFKSHWMEPTRLRNQGFCTWPSASEFLPRQCYFHLQGEAPSCLLRGLLCRSTPVTLHHPWPGMTVSSPACHLAPLEGHARGQGPLLRESCPLCRLMS